MIVRNINIRPCVVRTRHRVKSSQIPLDVFVKARYKSRYNLRLDTLFLTMFHSSSLSMLTESMQYLRQTLRASSQSYLLPTVSCVFSSSSWNSGSSAVKKYQWLPSFQCLGPASAHGREGAKQFG